MCISSLLFFFSCEKQQFPDYQDHSDVRFEEVEETYFTAKFNSLNPSRSGRIGAHAVLWIRGNQFYVGLKMDQGQSRVRYQQFIHAGSICPGQESDENNDGRLDEGEVMASSGERLIPLDGSLKSQKKGSHWFPISNTAGTYFYSRSAAYVLLVDDLRTPDHNPEDGLGKLARYEDLYLNQRIILLYGSSSDPLLPVACAQINQNIIPED